MCVCVYICMYVCIYIYIYIYIMHTDSGMLFCHLQQHGWNWRVLCLVKKAEKDKYCIISLYEESKIIK